jgi:hypothetical protein
MPASGRKAVDASSGRDCRHGSRKNNGAVGVTGRNFGAAGLLSPHSNPDRDSRQHHETGGTHP